MCSMDIFHSMLLFILVLKNEILAVRQFIPPLSCSIAYNYRQTVAICLQHGKCSYVIGFDLTNMQLLFAFTDSCVQDFELF